MIQNFYRLFSTYTYYRILAIFPALYNISSKLIYITSLLLGEPTPSLCCGPPSSRGGPAVRLSGAGPDEGGRQAPPAPVQGRMEQVLSLLQQPSKPFPNLSTDPPLGPAWPQGPHVINKQTNSQGVTSTALRSQLADAAKEIPFRNSSNPQCK